MSKLVIQWLSPDKLTPYEHNPKAHPAAQIEKIVRAIAEVGFDQPIVADENLLVIKGHGRLAAANQMGLTQVPVIVRKDLTEAQKRAARIADNKVAESDWLDTPLKFELQELKGLDYDLTLTGFDESELDKLLGLEDDDESGRNSTPPTENLNPRCKPGEVWALGEHRLLCGSSLDEELVVKFLCDSEALRQAERDITLVWSDPPYGMKCQKKDGKIGGGSSTRLSNRFNGAKYSFAGSGCSFLAAESLSNRIVFGVELIPEYCELTMQRWEKKTGREAELASEQMNCKI
ncbi:MAG: ParB N-terminal domain-containing protein [Symploca sp. SIO2E6]|nr:ParB N-terminal domain-containing protein [Symploca sp. SIO2E6]